jgi:uncharacterized tellurite resistance protein B-like protein
MPIRQLLKTLGVSGVAPTESESPFVAKVRAHVKSIPPERIEYLAGFAGQLTRVAHVDDSISDKETEAIIRILGEHGLSSAEAEVVSSLLSSERRVLRDIEHHRLNRAINEHASAKEKETLIESVYAVAAADHLVSNVEDQEIRRIAHALMVPHARLMDIRSAYRDRLEIMQMARRTRDDAPGGEREG